MNSKKIIAAAISISMMIPTVTFAKDNSNKNFDNIKKSESHASVQANKTEKSIKSFIQSLTGDKKESDNDEKGKGKEQNKQNKEEKKAQIDAFKTEMRLKHEEMKAIKAETNQVKKDIEKKIVDLRSIVGDIKDGKKTLGQDSLNALIASLKELKADSDNVKAASDVNTVVTETQDKVNKKDFNNALASMDKVIAKLQARLDALKKLDTALADALEIAKLAAEPSTAVPTETPAVTPETTPTVTPQDGAVTGSN